MNLPFPRRIATVAGITPTRVAATLLAYQLANACSHRDLA